MLFDDRRIGDTPGRELDLEFLLRDERRSQAFPVPRSTPTARSGMSSTPRFALLSPPTVRPGVMTWATAPGNAAGYPIWYPTVSFVPAACAASYPVIRTDVVPSAKNSTLSGELSSGGYIWIDVSACATSIARPPSRGEDPGIVDVGGGRGGVGEDSERRRRTQRGNPERGFQTCVKKGVAHRIYLFRRGHSVTTDVANREQRIEAGSLSVAEPVSVRLRNRNTLASHQDHWSHT